MIQEKDFLYRVPVKTAPITTPRGQIRNPEILVDLEGGEFMHGNILDANSTNKLINQSVKDAVDNKLIESGYVTKDLLEAETTRATEQENSLKTLIGAETSARAKGDEDLSSKIELSNHVLTTALNKQVNTLNTAISAKQDAGNYIPYDASVAGIYLVDKTICVKANDVNTEKNSQLAASSLLFSNGIKTRTFYTVDGITSNQHNDCLATSDGTFKPISDFVLKEDAEEEYATPDQINDIKVGLAKKQDKIKVNSVDVTNLNKANIDQLRNIVQELLIALDSSGLIIMSDGFE